METATQEAPPTGLSATPPAKAAFKPTPPRGAVKKGIPSDGYWVIAGLAKGGKTDFMASIPGALIIETEEGGADRVSGWIQDVGGDMAAFREALTFGFTDPSVKIIVIDTLDVVLKNMARESANKFGLESISEKREGVNTFAVWDDLFLKVERMTDKFRNCGKLVLLAAHFKEPKLDNEGKLVITQSIDAPSSKVSSHLCAHADVIGVCAKKRIGDKSRYEIRFHGDGVVGAYGSRIPELEDKTIVLAKGQQWAAIMAAFEAAPAKATVPAAPQTNGKTAAATVAKGGKK